MTNGHSQARGCVAGMVLLACALGVAAQERRVVAVNVLDEEGRQVAGLRAENFRGKYRGQPVKIVSAEWDVRPRRIVILLDMSGSMGWGKKLEVARKAAEDVVFYGPPENQVALIRFSTRPEEVVDFGAGRQGVADGLARIMKEETKAEGRTALLDAMVEASRLLEPGRLGDVLYVVTDGGDNASRSRGRDVMDAVLCSQTRVFFLFFDDPDRAVRGPEYAYGPRLAEEFAESSGGFVLAPFSSLYTGIGAWDLSPSERAELASRVRWLYELMASYYRVEVELPVEVDKTRRWELEVVEAAPFASQSAAQDKPFGPQGVPQGKGKKRKDVRVVYPRKLAACEERSD